MPFLLVEPDCPLDNWVGRLGRLGSCCPVEHRQTLGPCPTV